MGRFLQLEGDKIIQFFLKFVRKIFFRCSNEYKAMKDFQKIPFMGKWYEVERFYLMRDVVAKCIQVNYERFDDGRIYVNNIYTNRM